MRNSQNGYIESAKIKLRLAHPNLSKEDRTVQRHPDFAGHWKLISSPLKDSPGEKSLELTLENAGPHKLKARVRGCDQFSTEVDSDDHASGSFDGPAGEISWLSQGSREKAKIIRIGPYLVWEINSTTLGNCSPLSAILKKVEEKR
jgi:hypothetical protein